MVRAGFLMKEPIDPAKQLPKAQEDPLHINRLELITIIIKPFATLQTLVCSSSEITEAEMVNPARKNCLFTRSQMRHQVVELHAI